MMYDEIINRINENDWEGALKELTVTMGQTEFNEKTAVLSATVFIGIGNIVMARNAISKGLQLNFRNYELWLLLGQSHECTNVNQAYLCYENALFYCDDNDDAQIIQAFMNNVMASEYFCVRKTAIVILSYNSLPHTRGCIESIRRTCAPDTYEIVVIDNSSSDDSVVWLGKQPDIKLQCNDKNVGFPRGCNQGIYLAEKDSDVFLLNNDTILADNSLFWLRMGLYENDKVGAVGAVSNCISNLQQVTWNCTEPEEYLEAARMNNLPQKHPYQEKNWLIGFALLIKRNCLEEVGYLDEDFSPGQFEDNDLGLRLRMAGYRSILCKNSFIFHFGSSSGKNVKKWKQLFYRNLKRIQEKWGFQVTDYIYPDMVLLSKISSFGETPIRVLHIGSGIGATLLELQNCCPEIQLYGIETDKSMLRVTPESLKVYRCNIIKEKLPFDKTFFDIIMCSEVYENLILQKPLINNLMEYLKPGGRLISHKLDIKKERT